MTSGSALCFTEVFCALQERGAGVGRVGHEGFLMALCPPSLSACAPGRVREAQASATCCSRGPGIQKDPC